MIEFWILLIKTSYLLFLAVTYSLAMWKSNVSQIQIFSKSCNLLELITQQPFQLSFDCTGRTVDIVYLYFISIIHSLFSHWIIHFNGMWKQSTTWRHQKGHRNTKKFWVNIFFIHQQQNWMKFSLPPTHNIFLFYP